MNTHFLEFNLEHSGVVFQVGVSQIAISCPPSITKRVIGLSTSKILPTGSVIPYHAAAQRSHFFSSSLNAIVEDSNEGESATGIARECKFCPRVDIMKSYGIKNLGQTRNSRCDVDAS